MKLLFWGYLSQLGIILNIFFGLFFAAIITKLGEGLSDAFNRLIKGFQLLNLSEKEKKWKSRLYAT